MERVQRVRARTIEKYVEVVSQVVTQQQGLVATAAAAAATVLPGGSGGSNNPMDEGFKSRLEASRQEGSTLEASLNRARALREAFFQGVALVPASVDGSPRATTSSTLGVATANSGTLTTSSTVGSAIGAAVSAIRPGVARTANASSAWTWGGLFPSFFASASVPPRGGAGDDADDDLLDRAFEEEERNLEAMLAQSEARRVENDLRLKESERQLEKARSEQVARVRNRLRELQEGKISAAVKEGARVEREMRAHAKHLEQAIKQGHLFDADPDTDAIFDLREELRSTYAHLDELEIETMFPRSMRWKIRAKVDEGLFCGVRDLDVEKFDASFSLRTGDKPGVVELHVFDVQAVFAVYELMIRGPTAKSKLLNLALTPSQMNSVQVEATGEWMLPLRFDPGGTPGSPSPKWFVDETSSYFRLKLSKTAWGAFTSMPDSLLQWLASSVIPSLIESKILESLPTRHLGVLLTRSTNTFLVRGQLQVHGDSTPRVWKAPLVGPSAASAAARAALGVSEDESIIIDFVLRSPLAVVAGFDRTSAVSLLSLHTFRLAHAAHALVSLAPMLAVVEQGARALRPPQNWILQLLRRVDELAAKPVNIRIRLFDLAVDLDTREFLDTVTGLYLVSVEAAVAREEELEAARKLVGRGSALNQASPIGISSSSKSGELLAAAREGVARSQRWFDRVLVPLLSDQTKAACSFMVAGGQGGVLALSLTELLADLRLYERFSLTALLWEAPEVFEGFNLRLDGALGPQPGEYTVRANVLPVGEILDSESMARLRNEDDDARLTLRNIKLELFPVGRPAGGVMLSADGLRASLLLASLARFVLWLSSAPSGLGGVESELVAPGSVALTDNRRTQSVATEASRALFAKSRDVVKELWGSFRVLPTLNEDRVVEDMLKLTGINPLTDAAASASAVGGSGSTFNAGIKGDAPEDPAEADEDHRLDLLHSLFPLLHDDAYELHVDVRGMEISLRKLTASASAKQSVVRLVISKKNRFEPDVQCASFALRVNLQNVFVSEDVLPV